MNKETTKKFLHTVKAGNLNNIEQYLKDLQNEACVLDLLYHRYNCGDTVLHYCARLGYFGILKYLHETWDVRLTDINNDHKTILHEACSFSKPDIVEYLLHNSVKVDALKHGDWTPLMMTCTKTDNVLIANILIQNGANIFLRNKVGR